MNLPEMWQLRYFIAVAERLHFGRAAAALHISQPPLSRAIRSLEASLGVALFARTRRRVELTPEGARLLEEARRTLAQLERVVLELRGMAAGEQGRLRIGFVSLADFGVLPGLLKAYKAARPGVALALREMLSPEQAAALMAGELDFGLLLPPLPEAALLEHLVVQRERFVAAFYHFLLASYAHALLEFRFDTVTVLPLDEPPGESPLHVRTMMKLSDGTRYHVDYYMRPTPAGWKIVDVIAEGVSYVRTYRTDYGAEIRERGSPRREDP